MLKNLKIGAKLIGGFGVLALISAVIGVTGILCQRSLAGANVQLYEKSTVPEGELIGMTASLQGLRLASRDVILNPDKQKYAAKAGSLKDDLTRQSEEFEKTIDSADARRDYDEFGSKEVRSVPRPHGLSLGSGKRERRGRDYVPGRRSRSGHRGAELIQQDARPGDGLGGRENARQFQPCRQGFDTDDRRYSSRSCGGPWLRLGADRHDFETSHSSGEHS